jgi:hypothetical protein
MSLKGLKCPVSKFVNSDTRPLPTTTCRAMIMGTAGRQVMRAPITALTTWLRIMRGRRPTASLASPESRA